MTTRSEAARTALTTSAVELSADRRRNPFARRLPWWGESLMAVGFYLLYDVVQSRTQSAASIAKTHALGVVHAEHAMRIWIEPDINRWATHHHWLVLVAGYDYGLAHVVVTAAVLGFLWWRHPRLELALRNQIVAMSLLALLVYWLYPVSPPRFVVPGMSDTLIRNDVLGARHSYHGLVNLYAAMPSLHVAWALWCAVAVVLALRSPWRHLAWLYPCWTTFVVVATANHYLLDAAAGAALAGVFLLPVVSSAGRQRAT